MEPDWKLKYKNAESKIKQLENNINYMKAQEPKGLEKFIEYTVGFLMMGTLYLLGFGVVGLILAALADGF